jgi:hypothetical protein
VLRLSKSATMTIAVVSFVLSALLLTFVSFQLLRLPNWWLLHWFWPSGLYLASGGSSDYDLYNPFLFGIPLALFCRCRSRVFGPVWIVMSLAIYLATLYCALFLSLSFEPAWKAIGGRGEGWLVLPWVVVGGFGGYLFARAFHILGRRLRASETRCLMLAGLVGGVCSFLVPWGWHVTVGPLLVWLSLVEDRPPRSVHAGLAAARPGTT